MGSIAIVGAKLSMSIVSLVTMASSLAFVETFYFPYIPYG